MKTKHYLIVFICSFSFNILYSLLNPILRSNKSLRENQELFVYLVGFSTILVFISFIGLLIKIYKYEHKNDFLNS